MEKLYGVLCWQTVIETGFLLLLLFLAELIGIMKFKLLFEDIVQMMIKKKFPNETESSLSYMYH
jgi:hypothetical protein